MIRFSHKTKQVISAIFWLIFLIALTMAMFTGCCTCKSIPVESRIDQDKREWLQQVKEGKLTRCEYNELLISDYELEEIIKIYRNK